MSNHWLGASLLLGCLLAGCGSASSGVSVAGAGTAGALQGGGGAASGAGGAGGLAGAPSDAGSAGSAGSVSTLRFSERKLSASDRFACAIDAQAKVICWGNGANWSADRPEDQGVESIATSDASRCNRSPNGDVRCFGIQAKDRPGTFTQVAMTNFDGGCGLAADGSVSCFARLSEGWTAPSGKFASLAIGGNGSYVCGVQEGGELQCFGSVPTSVAAAVPPGKFTRVYTAQLAACAIALDSTVSCWGSLQVRLPPDAKAQQVALGSDFACLLSSTGQVTCHGSNRGVVGQEPNLPLTEIASGDDYVCGFTSTHSLVCWGSMPSTPPSDFAAP